MDRQYKFRFWGYFDEFDENDGPQMSMMSGDVFSFNEELPVNELFEESKDFKIMQFTGVVDINGKEMYEGDIVRETTFTLNQIFIHHIGFSSGTFWLVNGGYSETIKDALDSLSLLEIIGNIYENPELIIK